MYSESGNKSEAIFLFAVVSDMTVCIFRLFLSVLSKMVLYFHTRGVKILFPQLLDVDKWHALSESQFLPL